jgi:hypothetical protein
MAFLAGSFLKTLGDCTLFTDFLEAVENTLGAPPRVSNPHPLYAAPSPDPAQNIGPDPG